MKAFAAATRPHRSTRWRWLAVPLALVSTIATAMADGPPPPGTTTEGIPQTWPSPAIAPVVDLPVHFNTPMTLPASASVPTGPVVPSTDALSQLDPSVPDLCSELPPGLTIQCDANTGGGTSTGPPHVTLATSLSAQVYAAGEAIGFTLTVSNPYATQTTVSSTTDPIPTGFLPVPAGGITMDGSPCNANTSPACTVGSTGLQVSSFSLSKNQQHVFAYAMVVNWSPRGCGLLTNQALVSSSTGAVTSSATVIGCDGGLGAEPWWSFRTQPIGPQGTLSINANSANLVVTQDDSTAVPGHGRLVLQPHRVYNSQFDGNGAPIDALGTGWTVDYEQWTGSPSGTMGIGALFVPPAESVSANHPVTILDDTGGRQVVSLQLLPTPINATALQQQGDTSPWSVVVPRVLQLDTKHYDHICVDETASPTAGVHGGLWRYTEVKAASTSTPCSPANRTTPVVLGWGAERPDRVRYEFAWNGAKLDAEDGNANEVKYTYASAPTAGASLGNLGTVTEVSSGRHFSLTKISSTETDITDPAGRTTKYLFSSSGLLTTVNNPDGHGITYSYGSGCTGATIYQLCSVTDPNGNATNFSYTTTWSDGTAVSGPPKLASFTDRAGATTTITSVHSPDNLTADLGIERTRFMNFDAAGSAGEIDGIDMTNGSSPATVHQTLNSWDTATGVTSCTKPDGGADHNLCRTFTETINGQSTAEDDTYTYNMVGQPLVRRQCLASSDSSTPPPCPASTASTLTSRDSTWGYNAMYVEATGTTNTYTDTPQGGGTVSSTTVTGGGRWDAQTLYTLYDNVSKLGPVGNTPGFSSTQVQSYLRTTAVDASSQLAPNRQVSGTTCSTVTGNSGVICSTTGPDGNTANNYAYTYDQFGQRLTMATPNVLAASAQPFSYTYYPDSTKDLSGTTSAGGWLEAVTDPYGHFEAYAYDAAGNLTRTWDKDATSGLSLTAFPGTISAPPNSAYSEVLHGTGNGTTPYQTPWRYVLSSRDQLGDTTSYTIDNNGNDVTITPPRGTAAGSAAYNVTQTFNARDQLLSTLEPVEATKSPQQPRTYSYDTAGNRISTMDPNGVVTVYIYDAVNRLKTTKYTLEANGPGVVIPQSCSVSQSSDKPIPSGRILCTRTQSYDGVDNATSSTDGNGQTTTYDYDGVHDQLDRNAPRQDGTFTTLRTGYAYDLDGNRTLVCPPRTFTEGNGKSCTNPGAGQTAYETAASYDVMDRMVQYTTYVFGCSPLVACNTSTGVLGHTYTYQYDADGNEVSVTDPNSHVRTMTYDLLDRRTGLSTPRSSSQSVQTTNTYDPAGRRLSETVGSYETGYAYDAAGRLTDKVVGWDGKASVSSATASTDGGTNIHSRQTYDPDGHVTAVYDPRAFTGSSTDQRTFMQTMVYDADGRPTDQYTPRFDGASYSDLSSGSSTQSTECPTSTAGYPTTVGVCAEHITYDGVGEATSMVLPTATGGNPSRTVTYGYTDDRHVLSITQPSPLGAESYSYDAEGRVVKYVDGLSRPTTIAYTSDGLRSVLTQEPNGSTNHITNYTYDGNGNLLTLADPAGLKTSYTYFSDDHKATAADNAGDTTSYFYDGVGNPTGIDPPSATAKAAPDPSGTGTINTYTFDNLLLATTKPISQDGTSQLRQTTYTYADFGAKASQDTALVKLNTASRTTSYTVLSDAGTQSFSYYPSERLQQETGRSSEKITHTYDAAGNQTSVVDGSSTVSASYYLDDLARSATDTAPTAGAGSATTSYGYDGLGSIASRAESLSTGGQYVTDYTYADAELPATMSSSWVQGSWSWTYDSAGQVTQENDPNSDDALNTWNPDGTLEQRTTQYVPTGNVMAQWQYLYDSDYRQTERDYHGATANNQGATLYSSYTYDNAGRLSKYHRSDLTGNNTVADMTATWDVDGNRLSWGDGTTANTTNNTYNSDDSIASTTTNNATSYTDSYNAAGDITSDGCRQYTYDGFDQMLGATGVSGPNCGRVETESYSYDGLGRQVMAADGPYGAATAVHFDGMTSNVAAEQQVTGRPADIAYALDAHGSVLEDTFAPQGFNSREFLFQDGYSSITDATGASGQMTCDAFTDPFGGPFGGSGANVCHTGSMNDTLLYRQAHRDPTSGVYQMGARTYNPSTAGFSQPDSYRVDGSDLGLRTDPSTQNLYGYVNGDPVNLDDPTGHGVECTLGPDCQEMQATQASPQSDSPNMGSRAAQIAAGRAPGYSGEPSQMSYHSSTQRVVHRSRGMAHLQDIGDTAAADISYVPTTWQGSFARFCAQLPQGPSFPGTGCHTYDTAGYSGSNLWQSVCLHGNTITCYPAGGWDYTATTIPGGGISYYHDDQSLLIFGSEFTVTCIDGRGCTDDQPKVAEAVIMPPEFAAEESTAVVRWDPEVAAKQLLGGENVTAGGRSITFHAADRIVNGGRAFRLDDIDFILDNGVRTIYNPLASGGPTIRVFDASGRSVVVDAETGMRVVTVIPQ